MAALSVPIRIHRLCLQLGLVIIIALCSPPLYAGDSCENLFLKKQRASMQMSSALVDTLDWDRVKPVFLEANLPDLPGAGRRKLEITQLSGDTLDGIHESASYSIASSPGLSEGPRNPTAEKMMLGVFRKAKRRALNFVFANYRQRREHWSEKFIAKLNRLAKEYENESTYINLENLAYDDRTPQIANFERSQRTLIGSIRLIRERDGRLPVEDYLGFNINAEDYLKIEPGNFSIDPAANDIAWIKIAIHLQAQMARYRTAYGREPLFITYADAYSERLYGMLGFKPVPREKLHFVTDSANVTYDTGTGGTRIEKDGVSWMPMYVDEKMMTDLLDRRLQRAARNSPVRVVQLLRALRAETIYAAKKDHSRRFIGRLTSSFRRLHDSNEPVRLHVELGENNAHLSLHFAREGVMNRSGTITVPYPLPENYFHETVASDFTTRVSYVAGILTVRANGRYRDVTTKKMVRTLESIEIWTDASIKTPTALRKIDRDGAHLEFQEVKF